MEASIGLSFLLLLGHGPMLAEHGACSVFCLLYFAWEEAVEGLITENKLQTLHSFRLELEVFDSTAEAVVVCFEDTAQRLTKTTAHSILTAESGLSRVYSLYSTDIQDKFTPVMVRNADGSISTLSNCLHSLVGSTQTLQLDSCTYYDHGHFESFNCKNVLLDGDGCKPFGSSTPPSIPAKDKGVLPIPTPVKRVEANVRCISAYTLFVSCLINHFN
ncbi:hypothetical protein HanIR_Chr06g0294301 [Helianthus annuus]|nr:hypothetical protein HanIR_Chr06g0294301 [Helianthus annuus]